MKIYSVIMKAPTLFLGEDGLKIKHVLVELKRDKTKDKSMIILSL